MYNSRSRVSKKFGLSPIKVSIGSNNNLAPDQHQGWGQFRNWNWNWYQFQFQFQELELQRNWLKGIGIGIGIGIDKEELKELIQFLFLIVNSFLIFC